jgi:pyridoxamine 5'-phosphate oxidase
MKSLSQHTDYGHEGLTDEQAGHDPIALFAKWLEQAEQAEIFEPNAMVLSTIDPDGSPSSRTVLLKDLTSEGFVFVTNYDSRKGVALDACPEVSAVFGWYALKHQVVITGVAEKADPEKSDELWNRRPHGAKLASAASAQSRPVDSRATLEASLAELVARYPDSTDVPRPSNWGAYLIRPRRIEFWAGRSMRFHDRHIFTRQGDGSWTRDRLQP